jgi:hypothetical protein
LSRRIPRCGRVAGTLSAATVDSEEHDEGGEDSEDRAVARRGAGAAGDDTDARRACEVFLQEAGNRTSSLATPPAPGASDACRRQAMTAILSNPCRATTCAVARAARATPSPCLVAGGDHRLQGQAASSPRRAAAERCGSGRGEPAGSTATRAGSLTRSGTRSSPRVRRPPR